MTVLISEEEKKFRLAPSYIILPFLDRPLMRQRQNGASRPFLRRSQCGCVYFLAVGFHTNSTRWEATVDLFYIT